MNKTKKGFLTASSIITIIGSCFAVLIAVFLFLCGAIATEKMLKESYKTDTEYTYYEEADGSYYFTTIEDGVLVTITDDEIEMLADVVSTMFYILGGLVLAFSAAKIVLAIRILVLNGRNKYGKGSVIALLVLCLLNSNLLEAVFLILAMCQKDEVKTDENKEKPLGLDDIKLEDINLD